MKLQINGEERDFSVSPLTLAALVETLGMKPDRVAVELNREIVPVISGQRPCSTRATTWKLCTLSAAAGSSAAVLAAAESKPPQQELS